MFEGHRGLRLGDLTRTSIAAFEDVTPTISDDSDYTPLSLSRGYRQGGASRLHGTWVYKLIFIYLFLTSIAFSGFSLAQCVLIAFVKTLFSLLFLAVMSPIHLTSELPEVPRQIFKELLEAYSDLRRSLTREMGDSQNAADVAQSSFERAMKYAQSNEVESPRGLLFRMARNIRIDGIRRNRRLSFCALDLGEDSPSPSLIEHTELHPERFVVAAQMLSQINAAIQALPPRCQEAFILNRQHGLSYVQVAERMGISVSQVEKYMVRSLRACREVVEE